MAADMYSGTRYEAQKVARGVELRDVVSGDIARGVQAVARAADAAVGEWAKWREDNKVLEDSLEMKRVARDFDAEQERRLGLKDGDAGSFFTVDGEVNREEIVKFLKPYQQRLDRVGTKLLHPRNQAAMALQSGAMSLELGKQAEVLGERLARQKQTRLMDDNYRLSMETGDYGRAAAFAMAGAEKGLWTGPEGERRAFLAGKAGAANTMARLMEEDPAGAFDYLNGAGGRYFDEADKARYAGALRARADEEQARKEEEWMGGAIPASVAEDLGVQVNGEEVDEDGKAIGKGGKKSGSGGSGSGKKKEDVGPEWWGRYSKQEIGWLMQIKAGHGEEVQPAVRGQAMAEALALKPELMDDEAGLERARAEYEQRYKRLGMGDDDIKRAWDKGVKHLEGLRAGGINPAARLQIARSGGQLLNREQMKGFEDGFARDKDGDMTLEEFAKGGWAREMYGAMAGVTGKDSAKAAWEKIRNKREKDMVTQSEGMISERYAAWRATEEGKKATPLEQLEELRAIAKEVTGHEVRFTGADALEGRQTDVLDAQELRAREFERANVRGIKVTKRGEPERPEYGKVDLGFDTEQKELPVGVLIPEGMAKGKDLGKMVYDVVFDNKHFRRFRVVGTTKGERPVMTYRTAAESGRMVNATYTVVGAVRSGDVPALMDEADNMVGNVKVRPGNYVTGQWAGTLKPGRVPKGLAAYVPDFVEAGERYGVNPALLVAIAMNETGNGTSYAFRKKRNAMGISDERGPKWFMSVRDSIFHQAKALGERGYYKGRSLREIAGVYAPVGAVNDPRGLNGGWYEAVSRNLQRISE